MSTFVFVEVELASYAEVGGADGIGDGNYGMWSSKHWDLSHVELTMADSRRLYTSSNGNRVSVKLIAVKHHIVTATQFGTRQQGLREG
jgi:hypothetical protein